MSKEKTFLEKLENICQPASLFSIDDFEKVLRDHDLCDEEYMLLFDEKRRGFLIVIHSKTIKDYSKLIAYIVNHKSVNITCNIVFAKQIVQI